MSRSLLALAGCAAVYGYALGSAHSHLYASRNLLKLPLLLLLTAAVCAPSYVLAARLCGLRLPARDVGRVALGAFRDLAVLLASLAPPILFVGLVLQHTDDGVLGEYYFFFAINLGAIAASGSLALARRARVLVERHGVAAARARAVLGLWLAVTLFAGGQAAFWLRPFFGLPATRGGSPPLFLGATPDVRGARNFYEMVWLAVERRELGPPR